MVSQQDLEELVEELFHAPVEECLSAFERSWMHEDRKATKASLRRTYDYLRSCGIPDRQLCGQVPLFTFAPDVLAERLRSLEALGVLRERIVRFPNLLGLNVESVRERYATLVSVGAGGLVARRPFLLNGAPATIKENDAFLRAKNITMLRPSMQVALLMKTPEKLRMQYEAVAQLGFAASCIARYPSLLARPLDRLQNTYRFLQDLGLSPEKINVHARLFRYPLTFLQENLGLLHRIGLNERQVATYIFLLGRAPASLAAHYAALKEFGLEERVIRGSPALLGSDPATIAANYDTLTKAGIPRAVLLRRAGLLFRNPAAVVEGFQALQRLGIPPSAVYKVPTLLGMSRQGIEERIAAIRAVSGSEELYRRNPGLITLSADTLREHYAELLTLGFTPAQIAKTSQLLVLRPTVLRERWQQFQAYGVSMRKLLSQRQLLLRTPEKIATNHHALRKLGITQEQIATAAHLLCMSVATLRQHYQEHCAVLGERGYILRSPSLLGIPAATMLGNVQYLQGMGVDYARTPFLLATSPKTKRAKMAWLLRTAFHYETACSADRPGLIHAAYAMVRDRPTVLVKSLTELAKTHASIERAAETYQHQASPEASADAPTWQLFAFSQPSYTQGAARSKK